MPPVVTKQLAHFCSNTVTRRNAAKRSEFVDIEFCIDFLFYIGVWVSNNSRKGKLYGLTLNVNVSIILRLTLCHRMPN